MAKQEGIVNGEKVLTEEEIAAKKEKAEATKDALEKTVLDDEAINTLVSERAELLSTAKTILGDKMPECIDCPKEIKTAVIDHVLDMGDLSVIEEFRDSGIEELTFSQNKFYRTGAY